MVVIELLQTSLTWQVFGAFLVANLVQAIWGFSKSDPYTHFKFGGKASLFLIAISSWLIGFLIFIGLSILFPTVNESYILLLKIFGINLVLHFFHYMFMLNKKTKYVAWLITTALGIGLIYYLRIIQI